LRSIRKRMSNVPIPAKAGGAKQLVSQVWQAGPLMQDMVPLTIRATQGNTAEMGKG